MSRDVIIDDFRQTFESDKQWLARKRFLTKHAANYDTSSRDQLLALSMVWVNHVFRGCRSVWQALRRVTLCTGFVMDTDTLFKIKNFATTPFDPTSSNPQTMASPYSVEAVTL